MHTAWSMHTPLHLVLPLYLPCLKKVQNPHHVVAHETSVPLHIRAPQIPLRSKSSGEPVAGEVGYMRRALISKLIGRRLLSALPVRLEAWPSQLLPECLLEMPSWLALAARRLVRFRKGCPRALQISSVFLDAAAALAELNPLKQDPLSPPPDLRQLSKRLVQSLRLRPRPSPLQLHGAKGDCTDFPDRREGVQILHGPQLGNPICRDVHDQNF